MRRWPCWRCWRVRSRPLRGRSRRAASTRVGPAPAPAAAPAGAARCSADLAGLRALRAVGQHPRLAAATATIESIATPRRGGSARVGAAEPRVVAYLRRRRRHRRQSRRDRPVRRRDDERGDGPRGCSRRRSRSFRRARAARFVAPTRSGPRAAPRCAGSVTGVVGLDTALIGLDLARAARAAPASRAAPPGRTRPPRSRPRRSPPHRHAGRLRGRRSAPAASRPNQYLTAYGYAPLLSRPASAVRASASR